MINDTKNKKYQKATHKIKNLWDNSNKATILAKEVQKKSTDAYNNNEKNTAWREVVQKASDAKKAWRQTSQALRNSLDLAPESLKESWIKKLEYAENMENDWASTILWYEAKQELLSQPKQKPAISRIMPSPLDYPSQEELKKFPNSRVIKSIKLDEPNQNQERWVRILQTELFYPFIRTEEIINLTTGTVISREEMAADHLLVTLAKDENPEDFIAKLGIQGVSLESDIPSIGLYRLHFDPTVLELLPQILNDIKCKFPEVICTPNFLSYLSFVPSDPGYKYQWNLKKIKAPEAWNLKVSAKEQVLVTGKTPIIIAVIDTGGNYKHEDLVSNMLPVRDEAGNLFSYHYSVYNNGDPLDDNGHGSHCLGIIAAKGNNDKGVTGIVWNTYLMACKSHDSNGNGFSNNIAKCIHHACDNGAKILNCSWNTYQDDPTLKEAFIYAHNKGVIVVVSAGNGHSCKDWPFDPLNYGNNNDQKPIFPGSYAQNVINPNGLDNIVVVAASTEYDTLAPLSNYGVETVDLAAPGRNILSTWSSTESSYATSDGTSMAAPHVAGTLALMMARFPTENYQQLIDRLIYSTDTVPALAKSVSFGRLNVEKALDPPPVSF